MTFGKATAIWLAAVIYGALFCLVSSLAGLHDPAGKAVLVAAGFCFGAILFHDR